ASGGAEIAYPSTATITIVDNDIVGSEDSLTINQSPNPLAIPPSTGVLVVTLDPVNGQWRLAGDDAWHSSGSAVGGLTADFYEVELRPLTEPPNNLTVAIEPDTTNWIP